MIVFLTKIVDIPYHPLALVVKKYFYPRTGGVEMKIYRKEIDNSFRFSGDFNGGLGDDNRNKYLTLTGLIIETKNLYLTKRISTMQVDDSQCDSRNITFSGFTQSSVDEYRVKKDSDKAECYFNSLGSIEDKVSQLFFLKTEAVYDSDLQKNVELMVEVRSLGGIIFYRGDFLRQTYLMDCYSEVSNLPLIMCNGLSHGLNTYLKKEDKVFPDRDTVYFSGLELAHFFSEKGVFLQMGNDVFEKSSEENAYDENFQTDLCKGLSAGGLFFGLENDLNLLRSFTPEESVNTNTQLYTDYLKNNVYEVTKQKVLIQENVVNLKFFNLSEIVSESVEFSNRIFLNFFKTGGDAFIFQTEEELEFGIKSIVELLRVGRVSMLNFNRILKKILLVKSRCTRNLKKTRSLG